MSHVVFLRHAETDLNERNKTRRIFNGQAEIPLTELGRMQAADAGRRLAALTNVRLRLAVSSTIRRCVHTANLALAEVPYAVPLHYSDAFRERSLGIFEGRYADEVFAEYPHYRDDPALSRFQLHFTQKAPEGENLTEVTDRAWPELLQWEEQCPEDFLVVSHGITIRCLLGKALRLPPERIPELFIPNALPIVLERGDRYTLVSDFPLE